MSDLKDTPISLAEMHEAFARTATERLRYLDGMVAAEARIVELEKVLAAHERALAARIEDVESLSGAYDAATRDALRANDEAARLERKLVKAKAKAKAKARRDAQ